MQARGFVPIIVAVAVVVVLGAVLAVSATHNVELAPNPLIDPNSGSLEPAQVSGNTAPDHVANSGGAPDLINVAATPTHVTTAPGSSSGNGTTSNSTITTVAADNHNSVTSAAPTINTDASTSPAISVTTDNQLSFCDRKAALAKKISSLPTVDKYAQVNGDPDVLALWKAAFLKRNNMSGDYFDAHVRINQAVISHGKPDQWYATIYRPGYMSITYTYFTDWAAVTHEDQFLTYENADKKLLSVDEFLIQYTGLPSLPSSPTKIISCQDAVAKLHQRYPGMTPYSTGFDTHMRLVLNGCISDYCGKVFYDLIPPLPSDFKCAYTSVDLSDGTVATCYP